MTKENNIKPISLTRLREQVTVPSIDDDLLIFENLNQIPRLKEPRRMNSVIVGVLTKGTACYTLNQKVFNVKAGDAVILTDGQVIDAIELSDDSDGMACIISYTFLYEIVKDVQNLSTLFLLARRHPVFPLSPEEIDTVYEYASMMLRRIKMGDYRFRKDVIRLQMLTLIYDLGRAIYRLLDRENNDGYSTRGEQIFVHYLQLVEHHFIDQRRVGWYAEQMGITAKYLSETVSNVSHHTPNEWIERYVTTEIRNQLRKTNKKISEIAEYMHFPNQSFLGKYFKENVGMSPTEYRKQGLLEK